MNIVYNRAIPLAKSALTSRALRQNMISSNIANVDTPFYRPKDIDFEDALLQKSNKIFGRKSKELSIAKTNSMHIDPSDEDFGKATLFFRDGHLARNDGNSVDLDTETTEMAKNSVMFNALISAMRKSGSIFNNVLESSSKMQ